MTRTITTGLVALAFAGLAAGAANAATIIYTITGTGSWTLDGVAGSGAFTVTAVANTTGVITLAGSHSVDTANFTFDLDGTDYGYTDPTGYVFDNPGGDHGHGAVGFGDSGDFLDLINNPVFVTYGLKTDLSPTPGAYLNTGADSAATTGGDLIFTSVSGATFSADIAPEPAAWALMLTGLAGLGAMLRARRKRAIA